MLEAVEAGQRSPFFKYMSTIFFFVKTKFFERFCYHNNISVGFYWILTYIWSISLCKISKLQESEMRPTGWTLSYSTLELLGSLPWLCIYLIGDHVNKWSPIIKTSFHSDIFVFNSSPKFFCRGASFKNSSKANVLCQSA